MQTEAGATHVGCTVLTYAHGTLGVRDDCLKGQQRQEATTVHSGHECLGGMKEQGSNSPGESDDSILGIEKRKCRGPEVGANLHLGYGYSLKTKRMVALTQPAPA